jgi:hypothetical protein
MSTSSTLPRFSFALFFSVIFCFLIISLYPIVNIALSFQFIRQFNYNVDELLTFYSSKSHILCTFASHYLQIQQEINGEPISQQQLKDFGEQTNLHQYYLNKLYDIEKNFENVRPNLSEYIYFVRHGLHSDICDVIFKQFPGLAQALPDQTEYKYFSTKCSGFAGGLMT